MQPIRPKSIGPRVKFLLRSGANKYYICYITYSFRALLPNRAKLAWDPGRPSFRNFPRVISVVILERPIKKQSLQSMAYETLRHAILQREIEPGETINITKLAQQLKVSTMPVREALRGLEADGLVSFQSNKRIVVNQLSRQDLADIYAIRLPLEELALHQAFDRINETDLRSLESLHKSMCKARITGSKWFDLNRAFHMKLHEMSGSPRLFQILQGLWNSTGPYLRIFSASKSAIERANREHQSMLQAFRSDDRRAAKRHLRSHLRNGLKAVQRILTEEELNHQ